MGIFSFVKRAAKKAFGLDRFEFERVVVKQEVIDAIIEISAQTYPKEMIVFLEGNVRKKILSVEGLAYQEYSANRYSTHYKMNFPLTSNIVGSVHSHPGPSNQPSRADLHSFSKHGVVHMIIRKPFREEDIACYDKFGGRIDFEIVT